ncbi:MAG: DNA polymerase III subunit beta [Gammaproteobacteria bacterium RBG_16_57_12]|nr:MAG: DNA polymerase III subunit beta [Gammaproteobacteria bacterium RBG_16_57_12]
MRFSIQRESLLKPLQLVSGVVERRQTLPILSNILLVVKPKHLSITGTDLEVEIIIDLPLQESIETGETTLPARKFLDICRALPEEAMLDIAIESDRAVIRSGKSRFTITTLPAAEFPNMETVHNPNEFAITQRNLKYLIDKTSFAMAQQDVRYYLNGMMIELTGNTVRTVATDGHRLALAQVNTELKVEGIQQVILPRKGVIELSRLLGDTEDLVQIKLGTNHIRVYLNDVTFTSKLIDGKFPDYQRVLPQGTDKVVTVDKNIMKQALVRTSILSNEKYRGIRMNLKPATLQIMANNPELEEAEEEFAVDYKGKPLEIGFNVTYLVDALTAIDHEQARIHLSDSNSSCMVQPVGDDNTKYVIMPMRI